MKRIAEITNALPIISNVNLCFDCDYCLVPVKIN